MFAKLIEWFKNLFKEEKFTEGKAFRPLSDYASHKENKEFVLYRDKEDL